MSEIFTAFFITSVIGTVLALILTLLRPLTRRIFSPAWHYYVWLAVLIVMLCPIRLDLPDKVPVTVSQNTESSSGVEDMPSSEEAQVGSVEQSSKSEMTEPVKAEQTSALQEIKSTVHFSSEILSYAWLIGAVLMLSIKLCSFILFLIRVHKKSRPADCPEVKLFTKRSLRVRVSDVICSPLLVGVMRPMLILPSTGVNEGQLRHILAHETTHLKRQDIIFKWLVLAVKCIHWFNPAVYLISRQISVDCEISCDSAVTADMDVKGKREYAETILSLIANNNSKVYPLTTGMTGNKKTLTRRFNMMKKSIKISKKTAIISVIIAVILLAGALIGVGIINGYFNDTPEKSSPKKPLLNVKTDEVTDDSSNDIEFTILFVGVDNKNLADTIILFEIGENSIHGRCITSTTYVNGQRIIALTAEEGGDQELIDVVKRNLNVNVNYYVKMDLSAVEKIIDTVGGMDFNIPEDMYYHDPTQDLTIDLKGGQQHLTGSEICHMIRYRRYPRSHVERMELQQKFIKEFIDQKLNAENIARAPEIFDIVADNLQTNYLISNLEEHLKIISAIGKGNISFEITPELNEFS